MQWLETQEKTHVNHKPRGYTGNFPASYVSFIKMQREGEVKKREEEKEGRRRKRAFKKEKKAMYNVYVTNE